MKAKIMSYLAICVLVISVGVAVAQQQGSSSGTGMEAETAEMMGKILEEDSLVNGDGVSEMKAASTWDTEMESLGLPPLEEIQRVAEAERTTHWLDLNDLNQGHSHYYVARDYPEGDMFLWAYHYVDSGAPYTFSGEITDYGNHDDTYVAVWFEYPSWNYEYAVLMPGQDSVTTPECTLNSDYQLVLMWQREHTQEDTEWDWKVKTSHLGEVPPETEYYAVIAGISDYMYIDDLNFCDDDAGDIYNRLLNYPGTPWTSNHIKLLIDRDATKANIKAGIEWMKANADADDVCMFFFSGHGTYGTDLSPIDETDGKDEYICPADMEYLSDGIRDDELDAWLTAISAKKIVMIDSCFSGGAIKEADASIKTMSGVPRAELTDSFAKDLNKAGYVVLTASDDDEVSWELGVLQNGVFAYCVDKGLGGPANSDGDKDISAEEIYDYIRPKVISATGDKQHPQIYDGVTGELPVVKW